MQTLFSIIPPSWPFAFFLIRFFLCPPRLPSLLHSLPPPSTPISITYRHFHSSSLAVHHHHSVHPSTLVSILFYSSSLWRCRNHSRSKLPLLSSPTQVLERNIYSLLSQYPVSVKCQKLYCIDRPRFLFSST